MDTSHDGTSHCTFCDLIRGAAEVSICHEDSDAIAFMDIQPVNNGHVLVVPRQHYESLLDVPPEIGAHLFQVSIGEPHYHVHIIPRRDGDGFDIPLPFNGSEMPDRTLLDAYAARIGAALRDPMKVESAGGDGRGSESPRHTGPRPKATMRRDDTSRADQADKAVALPTFDESEKKTPAPEPLAGGQRKAGRWRVEEGAHGELRYEPYTELGDNP